MLVAVPEEGVQRRRAGQADPHSHVDRHDGGWPPSVRVQNVEDPENREVEH